MAESSRALPLGHVTHITMQNSNYRCELLMAACRTVIALPGILGAQNRDWFISITASNQSADVRLINQQRSV
jgi:hypothetical protein